MDRKIVVVLSHSDVCLALRRYAEEKSGLKGIQFGSAAIRYRVGTKDTKNPVMATLTVSSEENEGE